MQLQPIISCNEKLHGECRLEEDKVTFPSFSKWLRNDLGAVKGNEKRTDQEGAGHDDTPASDKGVVVHKRSKTAKILPNNSLDN